MPSVKDLSIAYLGLGIMGGAMAANLAKAGARVSGFNRTAGKPGVEAAAQGGVCIVSKIADTVKEAAIIFTCLGDEHDVLDVLAQEVCKHAKPGAIVIDTTTIGPEAARRAAAILQSSGIHFLDAPVTGGDIGARQGTLTILVGGDEADFNAAKPALEAVGKRIFHCGPVGAGQAMKLCNQILCAVNMLAVSEALSFADELGISQDLLIQSLSEGAGGSWALANLGTRIARKEFGPGFMLKHMLKDLRLVESSVDKTLPAAEMAKELFEQAAGLDYPERPADEQGTQAMFRVYSEGKAGQLSKAKGQS
ncbi:MAG TPA: NAD(P)-dependent oxidoreductase [Planktothrix sp.]|jgi:3-hydroxyisobutyrate dehydrogenase